MSTFDTSLALVVPTALCEKANLLACALGHDTMPGNTFSVGLSPDGSEPATHWGCHSWVQQSFVATLAGAAQGQLPAVDWGEFGLTEKDVWAVLAYMVSSPPQSTPLDFDAWVNEYNLNIVRDTSIEIKSVGEK